MIETLKMFKPYIKEELCKLSYEQLATMYQDNKSEYVFASCYNKIYRLAIQISSRYYGIDAEDVVSICLCDLDKCLMNCNTEYVGAFTSMFHTYFNNSLKNAVLANNRMKRSCELENLDKVYDFGVDDDYYLIPELLPDNLTARERTICEMFAQGFDTTFIAEYFNITYQGLCYIKSKLKIKLKFLNYA